MHGIVGVLKAIFFFLRAYFLVVGMMVTLAFVVLIITVSHHQGHTSSMQISDDDKYILVVRLHREFAEYGSRFTFSSLRTSKKRLEDLKKLPSLLKKDTNIEGVLLYVSSTDASFSITDQCRRVVAALTEGNKPVVAFLETGGNIDYFLASASDDIVVSPATHLEIPGVVFNLAYFGSALQKLGIEVEVFNTGEHKSVFEPFEQNKMSSEAQQNYRNLEASMRGYLVGKIAESRSQQASIVRSWLKKSFFTPAQAKKEGLVDAIDHYLPTLEKMKVELGVGEHVLFDDYIHAADIDSPPSSAPAIGLVHARGEIVLKGNRWLQVSAHDISEELAWMREQSEVKAVVIRIDSPGGSALASEIIWKEVQMLAETKPTVISMGDYAASGGYYLSMGAEYIIAEPLTITGSIGVASIDFNFKKLLNKYGVTFHSITQSERKYSPTQALSEEDKAIHKQAVEQVYSLFLQRVAKQREMSEAEVRALAGGRVYTGLQAHEKGLVDAIGQQEDAFAKAMQMLGYEDDASYNVMHYPKSWYWLDCLRHTLDIRECLISTKGSLVDYLHKLSPRREVLAYAFSSWLSGINR